MKRQEQSEQIQLISWCEWQGGRYPILRRIYHIPNGGKRTRVEAAIFKRMGVKAGVPDLFLPAGENGKHGLYIELKSDTGRPSKAQLDWVEYLMREGYEVAVCRGWMQAADTIVRYLGLPLRVSPLYNGGDE